MFKKKEIEIIGPDYIKKPIEFIKSCPYKGTAFKVELEGHLKREQSSVTCHWCMGRSYRFCRECNYGFIDGTKKIVCKNCRGWFRFLCLHCKNGQINIRVMNEDQCARFIKQNVSNDAANALIFSKFYRDGSVDSEFTFTLPIEKAFYAIEFVKAFKKLGDHVGAGIDTDGAGMHLAILNSKNGKYPSGNKLNTTCKDNFSEAMSHFLPTLYFLGSTSFKSRGLNYRGPSISSGKGSAIAPNNGVLEYRVFETCYERPEAILDHLCVIAKTLKYYKLSSTKLAFFGTIGRLGMRDGLGVHRFYFTENHLKALDVGLPYLKPDHKTEYQLKRERNFTVTYERLKLHDLKFDVKTEQEWFSYKQRIKREKVFKEAKLKEEYKHLVKQHGKVDVLRHCGTLKSYMRNNLPKAETLKVYKDSKKKQHLTNKIVRTITV